MPLRELHVVTHTHWDREWYRGAERFRQRLVALVDELLDDPPVAGASFLLDGQAILLDDYLAVRPERAGELAALLRAGAIEAGPWYVLADELIPSGEALVRNLLAGRDALRRLRAEPPPVLYCPDSFGHPAILPDLAAGFGCGLVVLWRGYGGSRWPLGDLARWRGAAGSDALLYHLPPDGYEFGSTLPQEPQEAQARWERMHTVLAARARSGLALLLNGADHHARQRGLAPALRALAAAASPVEVRVSSLRVAATAIETAAMAVELPDIAGELRDSYGYAWTLQGTLGTRASQKRRNAIAERRLVRDVEPWVALAARAGRASAASSLVRHAWCSVLESHPHDTLCGTSIDTVAEAFDARLTGVEVQSRGLREDALLAIAGHDRDVARSADALWRPAVLLRNPVPRPRGGVVELTLKALIAHVAVGPGSGERQGVRGRAPSLRVEGVPVQILSRRERVELTEAPRAYPDADLVVETRAVGWVNPIAGYGVELREQRGASPLAIPNPVVAEQHAMDNGLLRVEVRDDGRISMLDHATGRRLDDLIRLERRRDVGDLYTPALRDLLGDARLRRIRLVHRGPIRAELRADLSMYGERSRLAVACAVHLQLDAGAHFLRVAVRGDNRAHDHRLRVCFATDLAGARTVADAAFLPVERTHPRLAPEEAAMEAFVPTAPLHRWITRFGPDRGVTIVSDGLAEYESLDDGCVAITLVRAVGQLSRADLPERPGHAGWPVDTPAAQSLCPFEATFAVAMHGPDGDATRDAIEALADDVLLPVSGETLRSNLGPPRHYPGVELRGDGLVFSAATPARRDGWTTLRCINRRSVARSGEWQLHQPVLQAVRARLDETPIADLPTAGSVVCFDAAPGEIVTILVR